MTAMRMLERFSVWKTHQQRQSEGETIELSALCLLYRRNLDVLLDIIFFFQAEDGIRDKLVTGVQTCALPIYVITLDADTRMPRETARRLVGKMAHPLNHPRFDPGTRRVVEGYGVLQPRVTDRKSVV